MNKRTDQQNIEGLLQGEPAAMDDLFRDCMPSIERMILANGGNTDDADDIFITGIELLYRKASAPGFVLTSTLKTFLYGICKNLWLHELRRKKRQLLVTNAAHRALSQESPSPDLDLLAEERRALILRVYKNIGYPCNEILRLAFDVGLDNAEIAQQLQFPNDGAFRTAKNRCKKDFIKTICQDPDWDNLQY